ncbi:hypothetical protein C7G42_25620 [Bradyrhizobium sp. MOS003]|nr:hypothetical protein C7G42_25620 [Bradyrhizobium sp. MOS003]
MNSLATAMLSAARSRKLREINAGEDRTKQLADRTIEMSSECQHSRRGQANTSYVELFRNETSRAETFRIKTFDIVRHAISPRPYWLFILAPRSRLDLPQRIPG